jgi:putative ABC transport system permease protein
MWGVTMRSVWGHRRRLTSTLAAVAIGVAFLAGMLMLGDTTRSSFDQLFKDVNAGTDVIVRPIVPGQDMAEADTTSNAVLLDESVAGRVANVEGVERVAPTVAAFGTLIGSNGEPLGSFGPPTVAGSWENDPELSPYRLAEGSAPVRDTDVVIDRAAATAGGLRVGSTTTVQTPDPVPVTVTGIVTFGEQENAGGMTFVGFTLDGAQQHVLRQPDKVTTLSIVGDPRVDQAELARRVGAELPAGVEARPAAEVAEAQRSALNGDFLDFFNRFLLVFAGIAMLVAAFSIHNTFSILTAQRTRDSALLRALGATKRQVLTSAVIETLVVGLVASLLGLAAGAGLAVGLRSLMSATGMALPDAPLIISARTVLITVVGGTVVTALAGLGPARRASKVAPLAALRDVAVDRSSTSVIRIVSGLLATGIGGALVLYAALSSEEGVLAQAALGATIGLLGIVVLGPAMASLVTPVLGWPLAKVRGTTGRLARENARRNPRRTAGTAMALVVGVAVVTIFTVVAQSLKVSISETISGAFTGDLVVTANGPGLPPELGRQLQGAPEIQTAVGVANAQLQLGGESAYASATDPRALSEVLDLKVVQGSMADLRDDQMAISTDMATEHGWALGTTVPVTYLDGATQTFTIGAVYETSDILGGHLMSRSAWAPHAVQERDDVVLVKLAEGVDVADGRAVLEQAAEPYAGAKVQDSSQYVGDVASQIDQQLALIYVMLVLAIVIALMGIANTLALSLHERVRELGLLRAVGQTRRQVRAMVRGESVIIALYGTVTGVALGLFLGWALVQAAASEGIGTFSAAPVQLAAIALVGALAGVLAARRPARRAARLDVLAAVAAD